MTRANHSPLFVAHDLFENRYRGAKTLFLAGSVVRGEAQTYSDIDLVVIFPKVANAYRESFEHLGWPVEASIHDPETLAYFFWEVDRPMGISSLAEMVSEGLAVPSDSDFSREQKSIASRILAEGPPPLSEEQLQDRWYSLSALMDDVREPRDRPELFASAAFLYQEFADLFLRSKGLWSANGKSLLKRMKKADIAFYRRFIESFDLLYATGRPEKLLELAEEFLASRGGALFAGYRRDADRHCRRNPL